MASIERTAYPRFKRRPSAQELTEVYTPSTEELVFIREHARGPSPTLAVVVLLESMQRLGYLPRLQDVPFAVVAHIRSCLRLAPNTALDVGARTLYRHHAAIRDFLQVRPWSPEARHVAISAVHAAAAVQDHPADLINVAIEDAATWCSGQPMPGPFPPLLSRRPKAPSPSSRRSRMGRQICLSGGRRIIPVCAAQPSAR